MLSILQTRHLKYQKSIIRSQIWFDQNTQFDSKWFAPMSCGSKCMPIKSFNMTQTSILSVIFCDGLFIQSENNSQKNVANPKFMHRQSSDKQSCCWYYIHESFGICQRNAMLPAQQSLHLPSPSLIECLALLPFYNFPVQKREN